MIVRPLALFLSLGLTAATAAADPPSVPSAPAPALHPMPGLVPLAVHDTSPRAVFVHVPSGDRYLCTTPCTLYVPPGRVSVTLVGWGSHRYDWEVPAHGGSVNLLARLPSGSLAPLPDGQPAPAVHPAMARR